MKLKAKYKWSGEFVYVKPVFFSWHIGIEFKALTGYGSCSIFCNKSNEYVFPLQTKILFCFIKLWYCLKFGCWHELRYVLPFKIKNRFKKQSEFPF